MQTGGWGFGVAPGASAAVATVVCQFAEPCGVIEDSLLVGGLVLEGGYLVYKFSNNRAQNRQFAEAVRQIASRCGRSLSQDEERRLHDEITKQGHSLADIVEIGAAMFCPGK